MYVSCFSIWFLFILVMPWKGSRISLSADLWTPHQGSCLVPASHGAGLHPERRTCICSALLQASDNHAATPDCQGLGNRSPTPKRTAQYTPPPSRTDLNLL